MELQDSVWFNNQAIKNKIIKRSQINQGIREFFNQQSFLEVETRILVPAPGQEPNLEPFCTKLKDCSGKKEPAFLISSPEYDMKKLLVAGLDKIFQITKSFRNCEESSKFHNPEFSILEWYRVNSDYKNIMNDIENLVVYLAKKLYNKTWIEYQGQRIDLAKPWLRKTVNQLFLELAGIDLDKIENIVQLRKITKNKGYGVTDEDDWETVFWLIFLNEIEPNLPKDKPIIIYEYPAQLAALSKVSEINSKVCERFEFYIAGIELGNAFSELTDPVEQEQRFVKEQKLKQKLGKQAFEFDKSFINALKLGMPESGGIAVGVDRLAMLLLDAGSIDEVIWFTES